MLIRDQLLANDAVTGLEGERHVDRCLDVSPDKEDWIVVAEIRPSDQHDLLQPMGELEDDVPTGTLEGPNEMLVRIGDV